jgi:hypothetical protein
MGNLRDCRSPKRDVRVFMSATERDSEFTRTGSICTRLPNEMQLIYYERFRQPKGAHKNQKVTREM